MTRRRYFLHVLAILASLVCVAGLLTIAETSSQDLANSQPSNLKYVLAVMVCVLALGFIVLILRWNYLRIRDAEYPGWYLLVLYLAPVLGQLFGILVYFTPTNYRQTRKKDVWMVFGLILCGVYLAVSVWRFTTLLTRGAQEAR